MKTLSKFLALLEKTSAGLEWHGWQKGGSNHHISLHGTFVAYRTRAGGFDIQVTRHDYGKSNQECYLPNRVIGRRNIPGGVRQWFEITITDEFTRFGRKAILVKLVIPPLSENYDSVQKIYDQAVSTGKLFKGGEEDRLSVEQALLGVCSELAKICPPV